MEGKSAMAAKAPPATGKRLLRRAVLPKLVKKSRPETFQLTTTAGPSNSSQEAAKMNLVRRV